MKHDMWYDENSQVLFLVFKDDFVKSDVEKMYNNIMEMLKDKPHRQLLVEMSSKNKVENRETRELTNEALTKAAISEVAFVGGSAANRMIAKVLIKTGAIKTDGDFFKTRENAIDWLKSKR